jgi:hypothetical protein
MELSRIIISETNDEQVIVLKEVDGDRAVPIVIGIWEGRRHRPQHQGQEDAPPHDATTSSRTSSRGSTARSIASW